MYKVTFMSLVFGLLRFIPKFCFVTKFVVVVYWMTFIVVILFHCEQIIWQYRFIVSSVFNEMFRFTCFHNVYLCDFSDHITSFLVSYDISGGYFILFYYYVHHATFRWESTNRCSLLKSADLRSEKTWRHHVQCFSTLFLESSRCLSNLIDTHLLSSWWSLC